MPEANLDLIRRAADAISTADALLIGTGAGMGIDSGLPDFRGHEGFWRAYPPFAKLGLRFSEIANPRWFRDDPPLAWGFYGHRMHLYRRTEPHAGFALLRRWSGLAPRGGFVLTSNVDGQFQKAGFDSGQVFEAHGSIHWLQCTRRCGVGIFPADPFEVVVDEETMRAGDPLPRCPQCGSLARPNILMFGDWDWDHARSELQRDRCDLWLTTVRPGRLVAIEIGAGEAIPTVRRACETLVARLDGTLIRINPRDSDVPPDQISLPFGALDALLAIDGLIVASGQSS